MTQTDDVYLEPDELGRDLGVAFGAPLCPAILNCDGTSLEFKSFACNIDLLVRQAGDVAARSRSELLPPPQSRQHRSFQSFSP
jgi:hypothetical protein